MVKQNLGEASLSFNIDDGNVQKTTSLINAQIRLLNTQLTGLNKDLQNNGENIDSNNDKLKLLSDKYDSLVKKLSIYKNELKKLESTNVGGNNDKAILSMRNNIERVSNQMAAVRNETNKTEASIKNLSSTTGKFSSLFSKIKNLSFKDVVNQSSKLSNNLSSVKTIAFGSFIASEARSALNSVKSLGSEMAQTSDSITSTKIALRSTGEYTSQEIDSLVARTQKFADKSVYSLSEVQNTTRTLASLHVKNAEDITEALGDINSATGGTSEQFSQLTDIIRQTAATGKFQWEDLQRGLEQSPETFSLLAKYSGQSMTDFVNNVKNGKVSWEDLKKSIENADKDKSIKGVAEQTNTVGQAMENLQATVVRVGSDILQSFSPELIKLINNVADSIGNVWQSMKYLISGDSVNLSKSLGISQGEASNIIATLKRVMDTIKQSWGNLKETLGNSAVSIAKSLGLDGNKGTILSTMIAFIGQVIVTTINTISTTIQLLTPLISFLANIMKNILTFASQYPEQFAKIVIIFLSINTVIVPLINTITTIVKVVQALNIALDFLAANPIVLVIAGVVALTAALVYFFGFTETGRGIVVGTFTTISNVITSMVNNTKKTFNDFIQQFRLIFNTISSVVTSSMNIIRTINNSTTSFIRGLWVSAFSIISSIVTGSINGFINRFNTFKNIVTTIINTIKNVFTSTFKSISDYISGIINSITSKIKSVISIFTGITKNISKTFSGGLSGISSFTGSSMNIMKSIQSGESIYRNSTKNYNKSLNYNNNSVSSNSNSYEINQYFNGTVDGDIRNAADAFQRIISEGSGI